MYLQYTHGGDGFHILRGDIRYSSSAARASEKSLAETGSDSDKEEQHLNLKLLWCGGGGETEAEEESLCVKAKRVFTSQRGEKAGMANKGRWEEMMQRDWRLFKLNDWLTVWRMDVRKTEQQIKNSAISDTSAGSRRPGVTLRSHLELCLTVSSLCFGSLQHHLLPSCCSSSLFPSLPPSLPPSLDLPCGCPVTLSRRGG